MDCLLTDAVRSQYTMTDETVTAAEMDTDELASRLELLADSLRERETLLIDAQANQSVEATDPVRVTLTMQYHPAECDLINPLPFQAAHEPTDDPE